MPGNFNEEGKKFNVFGGDQINLDDLFPLIEIGKDKPGHGGVGQNRVFEGHGAKMIFDQSAVFREKTRAIGVDRLQGRKVVRVDRGREQVVIVIAVVFDFHPYRLDLPADQVRLEQSLDFRAVGTATDTRTSRSNRVCARSRNRTSLTVSGAKDDGVRSAAQPTNDNSRMTMQKFARKGFAHPGMNSRCRPGEDLWRLGIFVPSTPQSGRWRHDCGRIVS